MSYDPSYEIRALVESAPAPLAQLDPVGLERYVIARLLDGHAIRPYAWPAFLAERPDLGRPLALVYDRPTGLVFLGGHAMHSSLCARLHHLRGLDGGAAGRIDAVSRSLLLNYSGHADAFITEGMGFRMGSPSAQMGRRTLMVGAGVRLTPTEVEAFADYSLVRI